MAFTKAQAKVWATGMAAALKRQSECETTYVRITREAEIVEDEQIRGALSWTLVEHGPLPAATTRIEIVDLAYLQDQMAERDAKLEQAYEIIRRKDAEIAVLQAAQKPPFLELVPKPKETRWGTIRQAAELHGVAPSSIRRACNTERIRYKTERINKYDRYFIDLDAPLIRSRGGRRKKK